jgi:hypothetical protein
MVYSNGATRKQAEYSKSGVQWKNCSSVLSIGFKRNTGEDFVMASPEQMESQSGA